LKEKDMIKLCLEKISNFWEWFKDFIIFLPEIIGEFFEGIIESILDD
jgi:phage-related protein